MLCNGVTYIQSLSIKTIIPYTQESILEVIAIYYRTADCCFNNTTTLGAKSSTEVLIKSFNLFSSNKATVF